MLPFDQVCDCGAGRKSGRKNHPKGTRGASNRLEQVVLARSDPCGSAQVFIGVDVAFVRRIAPRLHRHLFVGAWFSLNKFKQQGGCPSVLYRPLTSSAMWAQTIWAGMHLCEESTLSRKVAQGSCPRFRRTASLKIATGICQRRQARNGTLV